jgi:IstB-like ATP binding protein
VKNCALGSESGQRRVYDLVLRVRTTTEPKSWLTAFAAELVEGPSNASKKGCLQESLLTYTHPHVLVIDEVGYLAYGPDAANVLFHVVNDRQPRKRPMIFTTNKPLSGSASGEGCCTTRTWRPPSCIEFWNVDTSSTLTDPLAARVI